MTIVKIWQEQKRIYNVLTKPLNSKKNNKIEIWNLNGKDYLFLIYTFLIIENDI